jgi:Acetyltransferase (GNAT) domain
MPLFCHDWYLDAVCGGEKHWQLALVRKNEAIVGAWPYFVKQKLGWRYVAMPPLARMMGPYIIPEYRHLRYDAALYGALLDQLPRDLSAFEQDFPYTVTNWLPFYWRGFRQTTRYSYEIPLHDLEAARQSMTAEYRNRKIPKAAARLSVTHEGDRVDFLRVHNGSFRRQGLEAPISEAFFTRLDNVLAAHEARQYFFARDRTSGTIHAVAYLAWDKTTAWYLLAGDDPALRQSGASILLIWEAMRYAAETLRLPLFDFAGSMVQPIEHVRRQFGAQQRPYFRIERTWSPWWGLAQRLWRKL